ncbi:F-box family protein [Striga asiatica]|uniref:F-box family protein n=1 Tax=Striga asiatica TaxID=4170 RepID=A0A5A7Q1S1_STRAF|nr:F-box family protein [Striga asiatica]
MAGTLSLFHLQLNSPKSGGKTRCDITSLPSKSWRKSHRIPKSSLEPKRSLLGINSWVKSKSVFGEDKARAKSERLFKIFRIVTAPFIASRETALLPQDGPSCFCLMETRVQVQTFRNQDMAGAGILFMTPTSFCAHLRKYETSEKSSLIDPWGTESPSFRLVAPTRTLEWTKELPIYLLERKD